MEERSLSEQPPEASAGKASFLDKLISTGIGSGLSPVAPGTAGSVVGLLFYSIDGFEKFYVILPAIVVFFVWGSYTAGKMEKVYGHDPSRVVIDEIVGIWITLAFLPKRFLLVAMGFLLFRILDIFKPFPASYFDKRNGGMSIMLDDVVCGIYANVALQLYLHILK
ncbi:MAG: phosphatidylglycerophosphatase A [Bacteroidetes bacterium]|nr:phosphatidylglycerophosphatase A [Bacteroidota bacterium]